ncbi:plasma membrane calcium-transporting atpase 2 [Stemphylium lycopersici]|uniref:Plasma membrane calcium-transporting atpase 2 n=1 Tax=Stemphylium lycopersici TaxID=183478 RepID=A0A364MRJ1_STELY|nr:plasma membrane calcium-transporting atpase 2 [Stemphylium lycopersici]
MPRQQRSIQTSREGRLSLAIASYRNNPKQSVRALAAAYDVPKSTLQTRLHGVQPRSEILSTRRKLSPIEEQSLVQWILDLDRRGFPPHVIDVRRMADTLLAARGQDPPPQPVGKNWMSRFIQSQPELQTKAVVVQPGNREWVTAIECINASGWYLPPFVILSGKRAYGREIEELARQGAYHIDKIDFLTAYTRIRPIVFTQQNILAGFQATGLVPPSPDRVLSSLTVARTPSPPQTTTDNNAATQAAAQTETPHTVAELQQQLAMQSATILAEENKRLRAENQRQQQKKSQQRQYIASGGVLKVQQAQQLAAEAERVVMEASQSQAGRVLLASRALQEKRITSQRQAAMLYDAPRTTLRRRLRGTQPRLETASVNRKLSATEEHSLVQ